MATSTSPADGMATAEEEVPSVVERLTVALIGDAVEAVSRLRRRTGLKKVDIINRAVVVYEFIDAEVRQGKVVILRDADGSEERVRII
jgi:hypothetical protein